MEFILALIIGFVIGTILHFGFGIGKKRANAGVNTGSKPKYWYYYGMFGDVHAIRKGSFEDKCMKVMDVVGTIMLIIVLLPVVSLVAVILLAVVMAPFL